MPRQCARTSMASIHRACGRMVARRTGTGRTPVSAGMPPHRLRYCRLYHPTAAPRRAGHTPVHGPGSGRAPLRAASARARMRLLQAADRMRTPSKDLLPFRRALPAEFAPGAFRRCRARTRRQTGRGSLSIMNPSPVATLPRRSRESRTSHRRADADDDGSARRRSAPTDGPTHASSAPPVRDDGQHTRRRRPRIPSPPWPSQRANQRAKAGRWALYAECRRDRRLHHPAERPPAACPASRRQRADWPSAFNGQDLPSPLQTCPD